MWRMVELVDVIHRVVTLPTGIYILERRGIASAVIVMHAPMGHVSTIVVRSQRLNIFKGSPLPEKWLELAML